MKIKKLLTLLATGVLTTSLLVACSSNQSNSDQGQSVDKAKTVGFMQLANENKERIWFFVKDSNEDGVLSKNDWIDYILITKNGKADTVYCGLTFKDIKDKTNKEIISKAKKIQKKFFDRKASEPNLSEETIQELKDVSYSDAVKTQSNYKLVAGVKTDSSGNNVVEEVVTFLKCPFLSDRIDSDLDAEEGHVYLTYLISQTIYNQEYVGYGNEDGFFVTNSNSLSNVNLGLDTLDTKNVEDGEGRFW